MHEAYGRSVGAKHVYPLQGSVTTLTFRKSAVRLQMKDKPQLSHTADGVMGTGLRPVSNLETQLPACSVYQLRGNDLGHMSTFDSQGGIDKQLRPG